jgi:protein TonB
MKRIFCTIAALVTANQALADEPQPVMPLGDPGAWIDRADYPPEALRIGSVGTTSFELGIDLQGRVERCKIVQSSGSADLDAATCTLLGQRASFTAARDLHGQPTRGTYKNRVRWTLPDIETETRPLGKFVQEFTFIVEPDGKITDCEILEQQTFGNLPLQDLCSDPQMRSRKPIFESGRPVRRRMTIKNVTTSEMTLTTTISDP